MCYLGTFNAGIEVIKQQVSDSILWNERFEGKDDYQIYDVLVSSKEYISELRNWIPGTENKIIGGVDDNEYFKHLIRIDETIDQYFIFVVSKDDKVKFIWTCWDEHNCPKDELRKIHSVTISKYELNKTIDEYLTTKENSL